MSKKTLLLFDVDGTLTPARQLIQPDVNSFIDEKLFPNFTVGLVGGSNLEKIAEQMGQTPEELVKRFDYVFSENGLVAYKAGELIGKQSVLKYFGEKTCQRLINFSLCYMSKLELPSKRGTFVEFRSGLINLCPVGRSCSLEERKAFAKFDQENGVRQKFKEALTEEFKDVDLQFALGGQISIDCFPVGWDKTFCLQFVEKDGYESIHFFGDKTMPGGNDHEIFEDSRTVGHTVTSPEDTVEQLKATFSLN